MATLGGGSVVSGGLGMMGGIFVVAAAPAVLSAHAIYNLCDAMENNSWTPTAVAVGGVGGAVAGSTILVSVWLDFMSFCFLDRDTHLSNSLRTMEKDLRIGVVMVAESGAVAGLSASGITSGLAALGGGSIASGGAGMLGGIAVVASGAALAAVAVSGTAWVVFHRIVQDKLEQQRCKMLDMAVKQGFKNLLG